MRRNHEVAAITAAAALLAAALMASCASVAPGEDPVVVRTQQVLAGSTPVYQRAMEWSRENAGLFTPGQLSLVNQIRVAFPSAYRALDDALDLYKAGKAGPDALQGALDKLNDMLSQLAALVTSAGGPDIGKAVHP